MHQLWESRTGGEYLKLCKILTEFPDKFREYYRMNVTFDYILDSECEGWSAGYSDFRKCTEAEEKLTVALRCVLVIVVRIKINYICRMLHVMIIQCNLKGNYTRNRATINWSILQIYKLRNTNISGTALTFQFEIFQIYVDGTDKPFFFVYSKDTPFRSFQNWSWNWRCSKNALEITDIAMYALKSLNPENVLHRDLLHEEMELRASCEMLREQY